VIGVLSILLAYAVVLPTWEALRANVKPSRVLSVRLGEALGHKLLTTPSLVKGLVGGSFVLCIIGLGLSFGAKHLYLDQSFDSLIIRDAPSQRVDQEVTDILGRSQTPAVVLARDAAHATLVQKEMMRRQKEDPRGYTITPALHGSKTILSATDLVPSEQREKLALWEALARSIDRIPERARSEELRRFEKDLRRTINRGVLDMTNIPVNLSAPLKRRDRDDASVVLVFPTVDLSDAKSLVDFSTLLRDLPGPEETSSRVQAVSDSQLLVEILDLVRRDLKWTIGVTLAGIALTTLVAFGLRRWSLLLFLALGLAIAAGLGALGWMGESINFINALVFPVWFGLAVDASFHLLMHQRDHPGDVPGWCATMLSVSAAFITSMIGFGALAFSRHQGLASLAVVALVGLGTILAIELAVAGLSLWWGSRRRAA
jgi:predicted RND superfamily exporter protein